MMTITQVMMTITQVMMTITQSLMDYKLDVLGTIKSKSYGL